MLSLFFYIKLKFDLGQSLAQGHFHNERDIITTKNNFLHIFTTKGTFLHFSTFNADQNTTLTYRARLRLCRRTGSTVRTTEITYIFLCIRFTYTSYVLIKHPKHPIRIRFTCTSCVQLNILNVLHIGQPDTPPKRCPFGPFDCTFDPTICIRITYTFNVDAPLACPFKPLYLYV